MKRRATVEPVIGHVKAEHRMDRNYLKGRLGNRINAVPAAAGYNFGLLLRWLAENLACHHPGLHRNRPGSKDHLNQRSSAFFTEDHIESWFAQSSVQCRGAHYPRNCRAPDASPKSVPRPLASL